MSIHHPAIAPSAVTTLISSQPQTPPPHVALSLEILHNLEHQHQWKDLEIHEPFSLSQKQSIPLISGTPPQPIYIHPDEQAYLLEHNIPMKDIPADREWVIPTAQGEKWTLSRLAGLHDSLPSRAEDFLPGSVDLEEATKSMQEYVKLKKEKPWGGKRALLAMVNRGLGGDGTVVYYVTMEGTPKPRQN
ncbi:conserved hypothetical protein [Trichophyton verrucosum HKI 0517]|uniref:tRNA-splicing endonuclease subunit Sen15 domain-containing protein n=1 Tax=Trichophyton verrucosum (strain HKI 0517) TaxID=663202 RepID=D4DJ42_TRIVH|nr:uncharacterized protein TRV_07207 [Trichophyton verrucosum HKI 0517]EFE38127.1 conserved hypothetical protein [Trichophyton verrucosum HKI 0517]